MVLGIRPASSTLKTHSVRASVSGKVKRLAQPPCIVLKRHFLAVSFGKFGNGTMNPFKEIVVPTYKGVRKKRQRRFHVLQHVFVFTRGDGVSCVIRLSRNSELHSRVRHVAVILLDGRAGFPIIPLGSRRISPENARNGCGRRGNR